MDERPRFEFPADPSKARYGHVANGLKGLIDSLSRAAGVSPSAVVGGLVAVVGLGAAVLFAAVWVVARDLGRRPAETSRPAVTAEDSGLAAPERAPLNSMDRGASPMPTDRLGSLAGVGGDEEASGPPSNGASFDGAAGGRTLKLSSFLKDHSSEAADYRKALEFSKTPARSRAPEPSDTEDRSQTGVRPWKLKDRPFGTTNTGLGNSPTSNQRSSAQMGLPQQAGPRAGSGLESSPDMNDRISPESETKRRFATSAKERAGRYADQIPGVADIAEGTVVGTELAPEDKPAPPEERPKKKSKKGEVEGPVKQEKVPEVGPGVQVNNVSSGGKPATRATNPTAPAQDMLSTPVDVNRIQIDADKAHDVDRGGGINTIGK